MRRKAKRLPGFRRARPRGMMSEHTLTPLVESRQVETVTRVPYHQHIPRIDPGRGRGDAQAIGQLGEEILQRVNGEVHSPIQKSLVQLLGEEALTPNLREWLVEAYVTCGAHDLQLDPG